ncbi:hypothetical protein SCH01S_39_01260 [Sphingomonas changbaiensis NBRC 104936]|uniref:Uncharacterized protein n=1 Tax=Sphingomonas changbaiensis NBRC 104936 TaxID=1219043 RepID=A0A0E9MQW0_9SPHN|nr:hypothetical protein SCH01S_39_01260 [Sphingomonas changbaiensis NBRC 104936]
MTLWQRHALFFALPTIIATTLMLAASNYGAPDGLINVSAVCVVVAIGYASLSFSRWLRARRAHSKAAIWLSVVGIVGFVAGLATRQPVLTALGGLTNVAVGVYLAGFFARWSERLKQRR